LQSIAAFNLPAARANEPGFHAGVIESQAGMELVRLESEYWPTVFIMWRSPS
jgi:hypothetical protein